ncbi:MAG: serine/threonine protein kinase [Actinobacteria bacterium]|nr:serine/threonine protein kinase [Actinomycetota bacterium]
MADLALALSGNALVLGRYRPLKPLGAGGSGSVWLARDEETGLDVALKIIAREGKAAQRAEREAAAAARLRHPGVLRAYAFQRDARHVYIAHEYVPGRTFREAIRAGELTDAAAIEASAQVCEALAHAHGAGILHRDVKPSNVLLAEGDRISARLLDFGLARMAEAETLTEAGDVPGTLAYISPERLAGDGATEAADVWAVGVMLWEALAGRHPFWQGSMLDTARAIAEGAPPLVELRPDLPKPLLQLVDRALSLDPAKRPKARELAEALRGAATRRRKEKRSVSVKVDVPWAEQASRAGAAALAAAFAGWTAAELPFYPHGWALGLALVSGTLAALRPRVGLAFALAVPVLPLGNVSLGLAILYGALALAWLVLSWTEPRTALLFALGPLLAPAAAVGLVPLSTWLVRAPARRAAQAAVAVLVAALVAGVRHTTLPIVGGHAPLGLGIANARDPLDVAGSLARAATAHHALVVEAVAFALVAVALPYARALGRWGAAGLGAAMLVLTVPTVPGAAALPLVIAAWVTAGAVAWSGSRT